MSSRDLLGVLERYYDELPRSSATAEHLGPFTLFLRSSELGWHFYARPRLGHPGPVTEDDVRRVRERQRELEVPEKFEWVHENTPELLRLLRGAGMSVEEHPLMVLDRAAHAAPPEGVRLEPMTPEHPQLAAVLAAVGAAFEGSDEVGASGHLEHQRAKLADGSYRPIGALTSDGPVGGGSHSPRDGVTELAGIAVLPRARSRGVGAALTAALVQDALGCGVSTVFLSAGDQRVADIYARVGFVRVGSACEAEPALG